MATTETNPAVTETSDAPAALETTAAVAAITTARAAFERGVTRPLEWRKRQLDALVHLLEAGEDRLLAALATDVGKPSMEAWATDLGVTASEVGLLRKNVARWAKPRRVGLPLTAMPGRGRIQPEPLGTVLIIAPWNYPVQLLVEPLAAALAAGNAAVVKPSELAPATSAVLSDLLRTHLDPDAVQVVEGGPEVATELLEQRWDHIFFTGSTRIGRVVAAAAAKHLTPVTLELGGKSPAIVHRTANLEVAGRRIAWGKFLNAGQTCIAPDYVLVDDIRPGRAGRAHPHGGGRLLRRRPPGQRRLRPHRQRPPFRPSLGPAGRRRRGGHRRHHRRRGALHRPDGAGGHFRGRRDHARGDLRSAPARAPRDLGGRRRRPGQRPAQAPRPLRLRGR